MRIAIYLPNLTRASGGAEVYSLSLGKVFSKLHEVIFITAKVKEPSYAPERVFKKYGFKRFKTCYIKLLFEDGRQNILKDFIRDQWADYSVNYLLKKLKPDLFINGTQSKIICRNCDRAIQVVHFPPKKYRVKVLKGLDRQYANSYDLFVSNSGFPRWYLKKLYQKDSIVLYPPVIFPIIERSELNCKENIILAVDRIVRDKKLLEMISAFKRFKTLTEERYSFVIVGNRDKKEETYYKQVREEAFSNPDIQLYCDVSKEELLSWYKRAKFFWHAKGYGVGHEDPEKMEHFGMTTVEAMTNGCIPIVIRKAGQKEIMQGRLKELTWESLEQLVDITKALIGDNERVAQLQEIVLLDAEKYQYAVFEKRAEEILWSILEK